MLDGASLSDGVAWYVVFLFSTTVHEASHALTALKLGDDTAHRGGQVSLDPIPHIRREPFGMVIVPIISYALGGWMIGWASAPYNPEWARAYPKRAALMAAAGPASNFLMMAVCAILIRIGMMAGWFAAPDSISTLHMVDAVSPGLARVPATLLGIGFSLNLLLGVFNLLPLPPLDGSSLPLIALPDKAAEGYASMLRAPGVRMVGLVAAWQLFGVIFPSILRLAIRVLYPDTQYYF